ncbi:unnamed protein product [Staurois parvus]|uniref:Uncharacterized protein n=1 Tax=Staurois parvus TaxID=386267 RepID=A0ABN9C2H7_9NEOB|nr:unnamed protein product [Staurois parvus]
MRLKSRYFLCELVLEDPRRRQNLSQGTVLHHVKEAVARLHGDFGAAAVSIALSVKYLNAYTGIILLRCRKDYHQFLWSSLPFITSLENRGQRYPCFINTLHVGGKKTVYLVLIHKDMSKRVITCVSFRCKLSILYLWAECLGYTVSGHHVTDHWQMCNAGIALTLPYY